MSDQSAIRKYVCVAHADARGTASTPIDIGIEAIVLALETRPEGEATPGVFNVRLMEGERDVLGGLGCKRRRDRREWRFIEIDRLHPRIEHGARLILRFEGMEPGSQAEVRLYIGEVADDVMKKIQRRRK